MNPVEPDKQTEGDTGNTQESLTQGVAEVMNAFFSIGASVAKTVAEATANTKQVPTPSSNAAPLNAIIHYSLITVGNVINLFAGGIRNSLPKNVGTESSAGVQAKDRNAGGAAGKASVAENPGSAAESSPSLPVVQRGGTLRVPLSIENPSNEPMQQMTFLCLEMRCPSPASGIPLDVSAVRFQPETLSVEPRDFEKLTVFIDTSHETSPGRYEAVLGLGGGIFEMSVQFEVLSQTI